MDFSLTAKQQELIGLAKEISEKEIKAELWMKIFLIF